MAAYEAIEPSPELGADVQEWLCQCHVSLDSHTRRIDAPRVHPPNEGFELTSSTTQVRHRPQPRPTTWQAAEEYAWDWMRTHGYPDAAAARLSAQAAEAHRAQLDAQRTLARVELGAADAQWFAGATPEQVGRVWETASAWAALEPAEFAEHREVLRARIEERFGIDMNQLTGDADATLEGQVVETELDRAAGAMVAAGAGQDLVDDRAEKQEPAASTVGESETGYDSDERRAALFDRATAAGVDKDTTGGRVRASEAFAEPSANATQAPRRPAKRPAAGAKTNRTKHIER